MAKLLTPITIRSLTFKNRIFMSPMCQYAAVDGLANDWHLVHLGSRAVGGCGLIIVEATAVLPEGRISGADLGIWTEEQALALKRINNFIHAQNSYSAIQLAHAGRKASTLPPWQGYHYLSAAQGGWDTVAPSPFSFNQSDKPPHELDAQGIKNIVAAFAAAARRSVAAGFDVIEVHAAHGYLLHQFLSPLTNARSDEYGGTFENRIRLLVDVVRAIRMEIPDEMPLFVRISATDYVADGWDLEQSIQLSGILKEHGVDLIDVSSGGIMPGIKISVAPGYQVPFAARIKQSVDVWVGAVGLITKPSQAEDILQRGEADVILLGRELLRNPYFALEAANQLYPEAVAYPLQYERAKPKPDKGS
jgi:2,4-dienoyl-CoA reductase-like NADH-dependent reductase (Old Yellow Enzyme family)